MKAPAASRSAHASWPSTRSRCSRWTRSRRPTRATPACRWAPPTAPSCSGRATCASTRASPHWPNRDRFVLSAGHGSMLLYSLLHLSGYDLTLDDLKQLPAVGQQDARPPRGPRDAGRRGDHRAARAGLRQRGRHRPRRAHDGRAASTPPSHKLYDHRIYVPGRRRRPHGGHLARGGLAGRPPRARRTWSASSTTTTSPSPAPPTSPAATTCRSASRATAGSCSASTATTTAQIEKALDAALAESKRPSLIAARTHIGNGAPEVQDTCKAHGEPLGAKETAATKANIGWPQEPTFFVPPEVRKLFDERVLALQKEHAAWVTLRDAWTKANPDKAQVWRDRLGSVVPPTLFKELCEAARAEARGHPRASPVSSSNSSPSVSGAGRRLRRPRDLDQDRHQGLARRSSRASSAGRNIRFGIREHAMGAVQNGLAQYGGFIPFGATFLVFSDYMRPAMRLAALGGLHSRSTSARTTASCSARTGPPTSPSSSWAALRLILGLDVYRPADALECAAAWAHAVDRRDGPTALVLSRQKLPPHRTPRGLRSRAGAARRLRGREARLAPPSSS